MKKIYSKQEKFNYHNLRTSQFSKANENKKYYSRSWLDGFNNPYAKENLLAVENEIKRVKNMKLNKSDKKDYLVCLYGFRNGLKTKLER